MFAASALQRTARVAFPKILKQSAPLNIRFFAMMSDKDLNKRLDAFQDLFVEARLSIEDCTDAAETTYFDEEAKTAKEAVEEAVQSFEKLISDLEDEEQKNRVLRGNGLKVEQLKGELQMALNGGHHH
mmetsp:Transcript_28541/g.51693  ORF Transcript_28541/g.51693 Transcript_28541/m.51693 type:complete len:128 (+) Transcript_28541:73-456(+)|eukprot:CAMPEP_0202480470 /NCGR_PEP_ID=MMETSP1361-20130828/446_1 /ASSEMBLY_ACC=CAM_ASM_000849 /TAXON_ID=210615 /ORGANISM="Staurosira complex sp., Strain CCMP2646" /LENGTH=127 /DNA_ID=CAMNT_0049107909 /DNA_START=71 /DNA_END=454 /DNA_ORIENTATION=+